MFFWPVVKGNRISQTHGHRFVKGRTGGWGPEAGREEEERARSNTMSKTIRNYATLAVVVVMTGVMGFAQAGGATYKAKCQSCHGADGNPNPSIAKMMGVKPASDATVKAHSED